MKKQADKGCDRERISRLMDGDLSQAELDAALQDMSRDDARDCWHLYHVIGDAMRAPELAACTQDHVLLTRVEQALVDTPRSLPVARETRCPAANDSVFRWKMVAGLASLAAVAVVGWNLLDTVVPAGPRQAPVLAEATRAVPADPAPVLQTLLPEGATLAAGEPAMLRDPELDRLIAEHRSQQTPSEFGDMFNFMRTATYEGSQR